MQIALHQRTPMQDYGTQEVSDRKDGNQIFSSGLQIVKPQQAVSGGIR